MHPDSKAFTTHSTPFLSWLAEWQSSLKSVPFEKALPDPKRVAILCVDLIVGFAYQGTLSSPRVAGIVSTIVSLFKKAKTSGVEHFVLIQDCHDEDTPEFDSYGSHCVCGTPEAQTAPELMDLEFSDRFSVIPKNSISSFIGTKLDAWLNARHQDLDTFVVVGDCTDLCTHQLAMHLRLRANAHHYDHRVIVPANCTQTYDMPVDTAANLGIMPHDADLLHAIFMYHIALNGVEIVSSLT